MSAVNLQEILDTILEWKVQVISDHNDGNMKEYYLSLLRRVNEASHWPTPRKPQPRDPGLVQDEEFGF